MSAAPQMDNAVRRVLEATERQQARASDPTASAWVSANAGAGKTHVLMMRVLRLLLAGTAPERILCLTYTKAAAAEMATRIFKRLSEWATEPDVKLARDLEKLLGETPTDDMLRRARQLFAEAIETPGGLKVQTIHAFCERLLQRFPLEAGIPPGFSILDDETGTALRREAIDKTLMEATRRPGSALAEALEYAVGWAADQRFDLILSEALKHRAWLEAMSRQFEHDAEDPVALAHDIYRRLFGVRAGVSAADIEADLAGVLSDGQLTSAAVLLADGGKRDQGLGAKLRAAAAAQDAKQRVALLANALLTNDGKPRADSQFISKAKRTESPSITDALTSARDRFHDLDQERRAIVVVEATVALVRIAERVMAYYNAAKARRAALDYEDLIQRTANLLKDSGDAMWVLYKLDGGLDHILVDEAQDTSPTQWAVIEAIASEFFSGASASETLRTMFAVGDKKQSIYGFQGAAPERFEEMGARFRELARLIEHQFHPVPLELSFRTVGPVLRAVDEVFADPARTPGLGSAGDVVKHIVLRTGQAGRVEIWDVEGREDVEPAAPFLPLDDIAEASPDGRLAARIADTIADWLANGEMLEAQGRPVRPSDILILVRKRYPFADQMVRALKERGIPVAGADQLVLANQIAIQDLLSLGDFLTLPEDDLALAEVLKSPLFDFTDDDLLAFAPDRKGTLWQALLGAGQHTPRFGEAVATLKRWRAFADFAPPFEFFATLLDRDGGRTRFLKRLGPDAADAIDEFMNLALTYDDQAPVSLQGFICWLREGDRRVKRDMEQGRDQVRVMTTHGAKGLEAPIVFLPDTCGGSDGPVPPLTELSAKFAQAGQSPPLAWPIPPGKDLDPIGEARSARRAREQEEHNRLLYVAMTRARDRLYVAGFHKGKRNRPAGSWYDTISEALGPHLEASTDAQGRPVRRIASAQTAAVETARASDAPHAKPLALPDWARRPARAEPQLTVPLAPSRLAPLETDETGEPAPFDEVRDHASTGREPATPSPRALAHENRFLRGTLTHALFEHLPSLPPESRAEAATQFVAERGEGLSPRVRDSIVAETLAVLDDPAFADVFGPDSRAEVPIVAEIPSPEGLGPPLRLNGQIDRVIHRDGEVLILDYKTNRPPPTDVAHVADAYLLQLAAYRLAVGRIFAGAPVRAAILWTDGCRLMEIPGDMLDQHEAALWALGGRRLDAAR